MYRGPPSATGNAPPPRLGKDGAGVYKGELDADGRGQVRLVRKTYEKTYDIEEYAERLKASLVR